MNKKLILPVGLFIIIIVLAGIVFFVPSNTLVAPTNNTTGSQTPQKAEITDLIGVDAPVIGAKVSSPLTVSGAARGGWFFEASFPVELLDAQGKVIAQGPAQAQGEWMTTEFVPFTMSLTFPTQSTGSKGTLVLKKDNPSGEPQNDRSLEVPVVF